MILFKKSAVIAAAVFLCLLLLSCMGLSAVSSAGARRAEYCVVLDAGHGGVDPGVLGVVSREKESNINLKIVQKLQTMFADAGFYLSGCCIWKKQSLVLGRSPYQWQHEPILFGWKKKGRHQWYTGRKESTIWEFDKPKKNKDHPTMKPIPLLAYPILNSSMSNAIVLDPFGGSGSTLIACEQTDRVCRTIELDEKFCDVIVKRYIKQVGKADGVSLQRNGLTYRYEEVAGDDAEDIPLF